MALLVVPTSRAERGLLGHHVLSEMDLNIGQWRGLVELAFELRSRGDAEPRRNDDGPSIAIVVNQESGVDLAAAQAAVSRIEAAARCDAIETTLVPWRPAPTEGGLTLADLARRLSRTHAGIAAVGLRRDRLRRFADAASVPVWNCASDRWQPVRMLGDTVTMVETSEIAARRLAVAVLNPRVSTMGGSVMIAGVMVGMEVRVHDAEGRLAEHPVMVAARGIARSTGARPMAVASVPTAIAGVQFSYDADLLRSHLPTGPDPAAFEEIREEHAILAVRTVMAATLGPGRLGL